VKWWQVVPVGSRLVELDSTAGTATFESSKFSTISPVHGQPTITRRITVDLWSDEVLT